MPTRSPLPNFLWPQNQSPTNCPETPPENTTLTPEVFGPWQAYTEGTGWVLLRQSVMLRLSWTQNN